MIQNNVDTLLTKKTKRRFIRVSIRRRGSTSDIKNVSGVIRISTLDSIYEEESNIGKIEREMQGILKEREEEQACQIIESKEQISKDTSSRRSRRLMVQREGWEIETGETTLDGL